jgi:plasmid stabilization system protein ParE
MQSSTRQKKTVPKKTYQLRPLAQWDLNEMSHYIAADNPAAARRMKALIVAACEKLIQYPELGQQREDLTSRYVRFWPVHASYMIVYDATTDPLQILRIFNTARHIDSVLS